MPETHPRSGEQPFGTGPVLQASFDELVAEGVYPDDKFTKGMVGLLADRIGEHGVDPMGFILGTELLLNDCLTGVDAYSHEPMPRSVTGMPSALYGLISMMAPRLARRAYGDEFGDEVDRMNKAIQESL